MRKFRLMCEIITFFSDYWCWIGVILVVILPSAGLCIIKNDMQDTTYSLGKVLFLAQVGVILYSTNYIGQEYATSRLSATLLATPKRGQLLMSKLTVLTLITGASFILSMSLAMLVIKLNHQVSWAVIFENSVMLIAVLSWLILAYLSFFASILFKSGIVPLAIFASLILGMSQLMLVITKYAIYLPDLALMNYFSYPTSPLFLSRMCGLIVGLIWLLPLAILASKRFLCRDVR